VYLNDKETKDFSSKIIDYFESHVEIPRMKVGQKRTIETLLIRRLCCLRSTLGMKEKNGIQEQHQFGYSLQIS
jgi:hypothetical protein